MICPSCGGSVPDGSLSCPHCHAPIDVTQRISLSDATWCPGCGALVAPGEDVCPKCGSSLSGSEPRVRSTRAMDLPDIGNTGVMDLDAGDADETGVITRIESAIPASDDATTPSARGDRMPRTRAFAFAALFALLVVGGATLLITHPWDPDATRISAKTPADTSMQGFPGVVESLSGQDGSKGEHESFSAQLERAHESLGELSDRVDESVEELESVGVSGDATAREKGLEQARAISIEVSNLIDDVKEIDDGTGPNADAVKDLTTLGNWLRNRCDALCAAWRLSADSTDLDADAEKILSKAREGESYARLFSQNYESMAPASSDE